jgi:hypothetical protein
MWGEWVCGLHGLLSRGMLAVPEDNASSQGEVSNSELYNMPKSSSESFLF